MTSHKEDDPLRFYLCELSLVAAIVTALALFGCSDSKPRADEQKTCIEPENPYEQGTGHYVGYEWAAEHGADCNGNSTSFNKGCEEYQIQEEEYEACEAKEK